MPTSEGVVGLVIPESSKPEIPRQIIYDLRFLESNAPKEHSRKRHNGTEYPIHGKELESWREGFRNGVESALKILESYGHAVR